MATTQNPATEVMGPNDVASVGTRKNRRRRPPYKPKSTRRQELDVLRKKYKVIQIDPELIQVLLTPSDPDFAFPIEILDLGLTVPLHYPHEDKQPQIVVNNKDIPRGYALNIEQGFSKLPGTLVERIAALDQRLETLLGMEPQKTITIVPRRRKVLKEVRVDAVPEVRVVEDGSSSSDDGDSDESTGVVGHPDSGSTTGSNSESEPGSIDTSDESSSDGDSDYNQGENAEDDVEPGMERAPTRPAARGTEIVFPDMEMHNMAVVEIVSLNLLFRCGRCKNVHEFNNLMSAEYGHDTKPRVEACTRCSLPLMVAFRKEFLHSYSLTAGYLDISGGQPVDIMPSSFSGACGECSAPSPLFRLLDFGTTKEVLCRHCHTRLSLKVELYRFDVLSTDTIGSNAKSQLTSVVKPPKVEKLRLTGGEPLPLSGACEHYRKSLRWFRFSCCKRVFPCDRCHDGEMGHPAEPASRMVCGKCSREQRFAEACRYCQHSFIIRRSGFWEGGKGTRDPKLLSSKDKRKHKGSYRENKQRNETHFKGKSYGKKT